MTGNANFPRDEWGYRLEQARRKIPERQDAYRRLRESQVHLTRLEAAMGLFGFATFGWLLGEILASFR